MGLKRALRGRSFQEQVEVVSANAILEVVLADAHIAIGLRSIITVRSLYLPFSGSRRRVVDTIGFRNKLRYSIRTSVQNALKTTNIKN